MRLNSLKSDNADLGLPLTNSGALRKLLNLFKTKVLNLSNGFLQDVCIH